MERAGNFGRGGLWRYVLCCGRCAEYNAERNPLVKTVLLDASEELSDVSSTAVREIIGQGGELCGYLPESAILKIKEIKAKDKE